MTCTITPFHFKTLFLWVMGFTMPQIILCQNTKIDVLHGDIKLSIDPYKKCVSGKVLYDFVVKSPIDTFSIDAKDMKLRDVKLNHKSVKYTYNQNKIYIPYHYKPKRYKVSISYIAHPKKAMYFLGWQQPETNKQLWTQGQGKSNSHWVPSFNEVTEKIKFDMQLKFPKGYTVISNGVLQRKKERKNYTLWKYKISHPMSSYLLAISTGIYDKILEQSKNEIDIEHYYYPKDLKKAKETYKYSKTIFDTMVSYIGMNYPWAIYREVPVKDFIHGGMENTTLTIFPDTDMVDAIGNKDRNFIETSAHELAHHWFGNSVTAKNSTHHWLQEGFATYYALLIQRKIFGTKLFEWKLFQIINQLPSQNASLLTNKGSSFLYYQKGAYVLHLLSEKLGGFAFKKGVKSYLNTYKYSSATTDDFIQEMEKSSGQDLSDFKTKWIISDSLNYKALIQDIQQHPFIEELLRITLPQNSAKLKPSNNYNSYKNIAILSSWQGASSDNTIDTYKKGLHLKDPLCQRYALHYLDSIPKKLRPDVELLLNLETSSYLTLSLALDKLCKTFKSDIPYYLKKTQNIIGHSDKNVRFIWLKWAIKTNYQNLTSDWKKELYHYTLPKQPYLVRQNAFEVINTLKLPYSSEVLKSLIQGCVHHYYQFRLFCRTVFKEQYPLLKSKIQLNNILSSLSEEARNYLRQTYKM